MEPATVWTKDHRHNIGRVRLETCSLLVTQIEQVPPFPMTVLLRAFPQRLERAIDAPLLDVLIGQGDVRIIGLALLTLAGAGNPPSRRYRHGRHRQQQGHDAGRHPRQDRLAPAPAPRLACRTDRTGEDRLIAQEAPEFVREFSR